MLCFIYNNIIRGIKLAKKIEMDIYGYYWDVLVFRDIAFQIIDKAGKTP